MKYYLSANYESLITLMNGSGNDEDIQEVKSRWTIGRVISIPSRVAELSAKPTLMKRFSHMRHGSWSDELKKKFYIQTFFSN